MAIAILSRKAKYEVCCQDRKHREVVRQLELQAELAKQGRQKYADAVFCFADIKEHATQASSCKSNRQAVRLLNCV